MCLIRNVIPYSYPSKGDDTTASPHAFVEAIVRSRGTYFRSPLNHESKYGLSTQLIQGMTITPCCFRCSNVLDKRVYLTTPGIRRLRLSGPSIVYLCFGGKSGNISRHPKTI